MIRHIQPTQPTARRTGGFTLVELMVTVTIIAVLAAITLAALNSARETARIDATRTTVEKINAIIMERYELYHTRRIPMTQSELEGVFAASYGSFSISRVRLDAVRDLMRMEMPDRWSDVFTLDPTDAALATPFEETDVDSTAWRPNLVLPPDRTPALTIQYFRKCQAAWKLMKDNGLSASAMAGKLASYASAECLYMIVMSDPEAAAQFRSDEIGDTDGDNLPEFLDGWGRSIWFVRWPAGFVPAVASENYHGDSDLQVADPIGHHDPFDPERAHSEAYATYPLIFSAGPDGKYNIYFGAYESGGGTTTHAYGVPIDPYEDFVDSGSISARIGRPFDSDHATTDPYKTFSHYDNIHNHRIEGR